MLFWCRFVIARNGCTPKNKLTSILLSFQYSGIIDEIQGKRNEWGADIVALLTSGAVSGCGGIAYVGPSNSYMYSVTLQRYGAAVFAHEVGKLYFCFVIVFTCMCIHVVFISHVAYYSLTLSHCIKHISVMIQDITLVVNMTDSREAQTNHGHLDGRIPCIVFER